MRQFCAALFVLGCLVNVSCDDTPAPPPELATERPVDPKEEAPPRPTTKDLLSGPRETTALGSLPLTARVPAGWKVRNMEGTNVTLLEGPAPSGDVSIQLSSRPVTSGDRFVAMVSGASSEMQQNPESIRKAEMRPIAGARVLERQRIGKTPTVSILSDEPDPDNSPTFNWTITVFIPRGTDYETYELNFIGMTLKQYEKDEGLLREVIDSVAAASTATTGATTTPAQ